MNLNGRVAKLERAVAANGEPHESDENCILISEADRVAILRAIQSEAQLGEPDPFPHLEGKEYLSAFWRWFTSAGYYESWPRWAQDAVLRVIRPCDPSGRPLPPDEAEAEVVRWWQEGEEAPGVSDEPETE